MFLLEVRRTVKYDHIQYSDASVYSEQQLELEI